MEYVTPKAYHVAATTNLPALEMYLKEIGASDWETDASSEAERLVEVAGRLCYRSFKEGLNPNVKSVRQGNGPYLKNILISKHGSVLEHGYDTYILHNVSRVLTHELVRHRIADYSQESLRFVRLDELKTWYPAIFTNLPEKAWPDDMSRNQAHEWLRNKWENVMHFLEENQQEMAEFLHLDRLPFDIKKKLTSPMRRMAPLGLATGIMITANHRTWRFIVANRTSRHAEEEIRLVFNQVFDQQAECYPNIYQDARKEMVDGQWEVTFENEKV